MFYQNPLAIDKLIFRLEQAFPILKHWLLEVGEGRTTQNVFQGWAGCGRPCLIIQDDDFADFVPDLVDLCIELLPSILLFR